MDGATTFADRVSTMGIRDFLYKSSVIADRARSCARAKCIARKWPSQPTASKQRRSLSISFDLEITSVSAAMRLANAPVLILRCGEPSLSNLKGFVWGATPANDRICREALSAFGMGLGHVWYQPFLTLAGDAEHWAAVSRWNRPTLSSDSLSGHRVVGSCRAVDSTGIKVVREIEGA